MSPNVWKLVINWLSSSKGRQPYRLLSFLIAAARAFVKSSSDTAGRVLLPLASSTTFSLPQSAFLRSSRVGSLEVSLVVSVSASTLLAPLGAPYHSTVDLKSRASMEVNLLGSFSISSQLILLTRLSDRIGLSSSPY